MFVYKNNEPLCNLGISFLLIAAVTFRLRTEIELEMAAYSLVVVLLYGEHRAHIPH